jgi:DNA repair photolyase
MGRYVGEPIESWGEYLYVKTNAVDLFTIELERLRRRRTDATILLSSVTDPYVGYEAKYKLTRGILTEANRQRYPGPIGILTKSPLVLRDLNLLQNLPDVDVGVTVTTTEDTISRFLEVRAPPASARIKTLQKLTAENIPTYAFIGPLLPHFRYHEDLLDDLLGSIATAGVKSVYVEHMNLRAYIRKRLWKTIEHEPPEIQAVYRAAETDEHRRALDVMVTRLLRKHGLKLRLDEVLYHPKDRNTGATKPEQVGRKLP